MLLDRFGVVESNISEMNQKHQCLTTNAPLDEQHFPQTPKSCRKPSRKIVIAPSAYECPRECNDKSSCRCQSQLKEHLCALVV